MDNNKTTEGNVTPAPTGVFEVAKPETTTTGVAPVENGGHRAVSEKTLRKRLARLAASKPVMVLAILFTVSAVLGAFEGWPWPITAVFTLYRAIAAISMWLVFFSAGKRGGKLLAATPLYLTIASVLLFCFVSVFIFCGMFAKMVLINTEEGAELVRLVHSAGLWAIIPALIYLVIAYCLYLFKRHERLICCNVRDGLAYGFPFDNGRWGFLRSSIFVSVTLIALQMFRGFIGSFAEFEALSEEAAVLFDKLLLPKGKYWIGLVATCIHVASLLTASVLVFRFSGVVRKYKAQKEARREAKKAADKSAELTGENPAETTEQNVVLKKAADTDTGATPT